MSKFRAFTVLAFAGLVLTSAWAEKADRNKPINAEADVMDCDGVRQVCVFTGRVIATKGTIQIRGDKVVTREDAQGYQYATITGNADTRAFYRQKKDGANDEYLEGEAISIEYDGKADAVRFVQKAELRQLRGASVANEISGNVLTYENLNDRLTVDGNAAKPVAAAPKERVRAMLVPKQEAPEPAGNASQPSPALKPSTTLGGTGK